MKYEISFKVEDIWNGEEHRAVFSSADELSAMIAEGALRQPIPPKVVIFVTAIGGSTCFRAETEFEGFTQTLSNVQKLLASEEWAHVTRFEELPF